MKNIFLIPLLLFITVTSLFAQKAPLSSEEIMKEAFVSAKKQNKKVLVIFHASWCGWCHKMDTSLNDASVIRHLVVFESKGKENLENPGAEEMLEKHEGKDQGIPFWLIFDKDEK